jgi:hypothetical protein
MSTVKATTPTTTAAPPADAPELVALRAQVDKLVQKTAAVCEWHEIIDTAKQLLQNRLAFHEPKSKFNGEIKAALKRLPTSAHATASFPLLKNLIRKTKKDERDSSDQYTTLASTLQDLLIQKQATETKLTL